MEKLLSFFQPILRLNYKYPFSVILVAVISAAVAGYFAVQLKIDTDIANLLPDSNAHVQALDKLEETVGGENAVEVAIKSPSFEDNKRFAEDLIEKSLELYDEDGDRSFYKRAEFRKDTELLRKNALYFATSQELNEITIYLEDEIQRGKEEASPFYVDFEEEEEAEGDGDEGEEDEQLDRFNEAYDTIVPPEYPVSPDSTVMVVKFFPTGSKSNTSFLENMFAEQDSLIASMEPASYHEEMEVRAGGRLQRHLSELESIMGDVFNSFASGFSSVILLVMLYFFIKKYVNYRRGDLSDQSHSFWGHVIRMPVPVLIIGVPLIVSLLWTFGITYAVLGMLNTMTSVLFVILFGMGIDYGIHFYARYIEFRSEGKSIPDALEQTYTKTGQAILVSGLTTAFSLFVLVIARFRGFSEFGFIAGSGIILALFCMLYVLPSFLVIFEKLDWILFNSNNESQPSKSRITRFPFARTILVAGLVIAGFVVLNSNDLRFQYDFGELEPEFPEYQNFREFSSQVETSDRSNPAYIIADDQEDVREIMGKLRDRMESDSTTILDVEALPERFPSSDEEVDQKLEEIAYVRELLDDNFIREQDDPELDKLREGSQTQSRLEIEEIPDYFKNQFVDQDGDIGNFVIVYPNLSLADGRNSIAFKEEVGEVVLDNGETYHAASTSIIAAEMLDLMRSESPWMVGATLTVVFILMLFSFRSLRWAIIAMLPLLVGLTWLFGIMLLTGLMFNFYNLVVLPAILGIGEDNGVHLAHRYRDEGKNSMWQVLSSTGQHITVGSITTMLGFSGLLFTNHPGLQSIGVMAVVGIGMTLLAALTFLPALIQWLEDRDWLRF